MTQPAMLLKIGIMGGAGAEIPTACLQIAEQLGRYVAEAGCVAITIPFPGEKPP